MIRRPALRYFGGKWRIAPWIIEHFPPHHIYIEPFGGAASVLLRKPRSHSEVYNDLEGLIVNVFRVLQNKDAAQELERRLRVTPWSRAEFDLSTYDSSQPIESARRTIIRSFMGHSAERTTRLNKKNGFRSINGKSNRDPAQDWANYFPEIKKFTDRMMGVTIEQTDAIELIKKYDGADTLFYIDPPYVQDSRKAGMYSKEYTDAEHSNLIETLQSIRGMAILSGYEHKLYDSLKDWKQEKFNAMTNGNKERTEILWLNKATVSRSMQIQFSL